MNPVQGKIISGKPPPGSIIHKPVVREIIRGPNQPPIPRPVDLTNNKKASKKRHHRTKPRGIPQQSRLVIPEQRSTPPSIMWEERCIERPKKQNWALAWVFGMPKEPDVKFTQIHLVVLQIHRTEKRAKDAQRLVQADFPKYMAIIFEIGYWQTLPVPVWLPNEYEKINQFNGTIIQKLMTYDRKYTQIEHDILRARVKRDPTVETEPPEILAEKIETGLYGSDMDDLHHEDQRPAQPSENVSITRNSSNQNAATTENADQDTENATLTAEQVTQDAKAYVKKGQKYGLAWVLPNLQRVRPITNVAYSILGGWKTKTLRDLAAEKIKEYHSDWPVNAFTLGEPISLPVDIANMQRQGCVQYDQEELQDYMENDNEFIEEYEQRKQKQEQDAQHGDESKNNTNQSLDLLDEKELEELNSRASDLLAKMDISTCQPDANQKEDGSNVADMSGLKSLDDRQVVKNEFVTMIGESFAPATNE